MALAPIGENMYYMLIMRYLHFPISRKSIAPVIPYNATENGHWRYHVSVKQSPLDIFPMRTLEFTM
jgi:hypothetical protein